jgi:hypothetical protein
MRSTKVKFNPDPLAPKPLSHVPIRTGMEYAMQYGGRVQEAPNTVMAMARPSLAQRVLIHRYQLSRYISPLTRIMSPVPFVNGGRVGFSDTAAPYPTAKASMIIRTAPKPNQTPIMSSNGNPRTARGGTQGPLPRFKKALPIKPLVFTPPEY